MSEKTSWTPPAVHTDYGQLWLSIQARASLPGGIDQWQARKVHVTWRSLGKKAQAGRL